MGRGRESSSFSRHRAWPGACNHPHRATLAPLDDTEPRAMSKPTRATEPKPPVALDRSPLGARLLLATLLLVALVATMAPRAHALDLGAVWQARHGLTAAQF